MAALIATVPAAASYPQDVEAAVYFSTVIGRIPVGREEAGGGG